MAVTSSRLSTRLSSAVRKSSMGLDVDLVSLARLGLAFTAFALYLNRFSAVELSRWAK